MEDTQKKVSTALDGLIDDLDKNYAREKQRKMFLCLADCYKDTRGSRQSVERCAESCGTTFKQVQRVMETELNGFQEQLQRCAMTCFDKQTQAFGPDPSKYSESQRGAFEEKLNKCVSQCADDHLKLLPKIKDRIISAFKS